MADGAILKMVCLYIAAANHPISMKFGVQMRILIQRMVM